MTELIQKKLSDSTGARWTALLIVAFTMMMGYFITDVMSPLEVLLETPKAQGGLGWTAGDYGIFAGSYGFINVFLLMLFFGGIILDKMGIRFTGIMACSLMVIGVLIKYVGVSVDFGDSQFTLGTFALPMSAAVACLGFAIFGVGCEICGITVSKVITKWFTGHELALAMGVQVGLARLGTFAAMSFSLPVARAFGNRVSAPVLLGAVLLIVGLLAFIVYTVMDKKLDASAAAIDAETQHNADDEGFHFADLKFIFTNPGFWCIALLCLMFYGGVFPFLKFATKLMVANYHVPAQFAGTLPGLLPLGTIALQPIFDSSRAPTPSPLPFFDSPNIPTHNSAVLFRPTEASTMILQPIFGSSNIPTTSPRPILGSPKVSTTSPLPFFDSPNTPTTTPQPPIRSRKP